MDLGYMSVIFEPISPEVTPHLVRSPKKENFYALMNQ